MDARGLRQLFGCFGILLILFIVLTLSIGAYFINDKIGPNIIESKKIIKPDYRLEANGKKIDTVYIYNFEEK